MRRQIGTALDARLQPDEADGRGNGYETSSAVEEETGGGRGVPREQLAAGIERRQRLQGSAPPKPATEVASTSSRCEHLAASRPRQPDRCPFWRLITPGR